MSEALTRVGRAFLRWAAGWRGLEKPFAPGLEGTTLRAMSLVGALLVVFFAALLTLELAIAVGLFQRSPRWRAVVALVPPLTPLAVYWALKEKMYIRSALWGACLLGYVIAVVAAQP